MAVNDRIVIDKSKQAGNNTVRMADLVFELQSLVSKQFGIANHCTDGTTFGTLETQFGLQSGAGSNFLTLLTGIQEIFNTNVTIAGQTRLDRLNEIVGRVAGQ